MARADGPQPRNPLHGVTLEQMVTALSGHYGWPELAQRIPVRCFSHDPSVASSLKFLRKTPWARAKVEALWLHTPHLAQKLRPDTRTPPLSSAQPSAHSPMLFTQRHAPAWDALWQALDVLPPTGLLDRLTACYAEPQRHYHTLQHLDACLQQLATARVLANQAAEVELALWFHDAIYAIGAADNEQRSADWARDELLAAGVDAARAQRIHALVLVTCHAVAPTTPDEQLLLDIDLSILGMPPEGFDQYERQVAIEFAQVPEALRRSRRRVILQRFLARPHIYHTALFRDRLEAQARANLQLSIDRLGQPTIS